MSEYKINLKAKNFSQILGRMILINIMFCSLLILFSAVVPNMETFNAQSGFEAFFMILYFPAFLVLLLASTFSFRIINSNKKRVFAISGKIDFIIKIVYFLTFGAFYGLYLDSLLRTLLLVILFVAVLLFNVFLLLFKNDDVLYIDWRNFYIDKKALKEKAVANLNIISKRWLAFTIFMQPLILIALLNFAAFFENNKNIFIINFTILVLLIVIYLFLAITVLVKYKQINIWSILSFVLSVGFALSVHVFVNDIGFWLISMLIYEFLNLPVYAIFKKAFNYLNNNN